MYFTITLCKAPEKNIKDNVYSRLFWIDDTYVSDMCITGCTFWDKTEYKPYKILYTLMNIKKWRYDYQSVLVEHKPMQN